MFVHVESQARQNPQFQLQVAERRARLREVQREQGRRHVGLRIYGQDPERVNAVEAHNAGPLNAACSYCGALHFMDERLKSSSVAHPKFGDRCCNSGQVVIAPIPGLPPHLSALFHNHKHHKWIK